MTDLEIAQSATMRPISDIARAAGIQEETSPAALYCQGGPCALCRAAGRARLVLVTAINLTPPGRARPPARGPADGLTSWARSPC